MASLISARIAIHFEGLRVEGIKCWGGIGGGDTPKKGCCPLAGCLKVASQKRVTLLDAMGLWSCTTHLANPLKREARGASQPEPDYCDGMALIYH